MVEQNTCSLICAIFAFPECFEILFRKLEDNGAILIMDSFSDGQNTLGTIFYTFVNDSHMCQCYLKYFIFYEGTF